MSGFKSGDVHLIGVASGLGAADSGCALGPLFLQAARIERALARTHVRAAWGRPLFPIYEPPHPSKAAALTELHQRVARRVEHTLKRGDFPVVLGGDHSIAAGTWRGVLHGLREVLPRATVVRDVSPRELGLLWIDAHMDSHTPLTSPSGNAHGMPLATLLNEQIVAPQHAALIGIRSFEREEAALLSHLGVRVFGIDEVRERGFDQVLDEALGIVTRARSGFGVSIDVDAIDPVDAPGTGTPVERGLVAGDVLRGMERIGATANLLAAELVEYNPLRDRDRRTARLMESLLVRLLEARHHAQVAADQGHVAELH